MSKNVFDFTKKGGRFEVTSAITSRIIHNLTSSTPLVITPPAGKTVRLYSLFKNGTGQIPSVTVSSGGLNIINSKALDDGSDNTFSLNSFTLGGSSVGSTTLEDYVKDGESITCPKGSAVTISTTDGTGGSIIVAYQFGDFNGDKLESFSASQTHNLTSSTPLTITPPSGKKIEIVSLYHNFVSGDTNSENSTLKIGGNTVVTDIIGPGNLNATVTLSANPYNIGLGMGIIRGKKNESITIETTSAIHQNLRYSYRVLG